MADRADAVRERPDYPPEDPPEHAASVERSLLSGPERDAIEIGAYKMIDGSHLARFLDLSSYANSAKETFVRMSGEGNVDFSAADALPGLDSGTASQFDEWKHGLRTAYVYEPIVDQGVSVVISALDAAVATSFVVSGGSDAPIVVGYVTAVRPALDKNLRTGLQAVSIVVGEALGRTTSLVRQELASAHDSAAEQVKNFERAQQCIYRFDEGVLP